jgi:aryl-phospho-beta-D-glucosidase BglC (GH1 family)
MLKNDTDYDERVFDEVRKKQEMIRVKRLINEARKLGLEVIVPQTV